MNEFTKDKPTSQQLVDLIDDELDITIYRDVVYGLYFEYKQLQQERDKYKSIVDELKKYLKEESKKDDTYFIPYLASIHKTLDKIKELEEGEENV